MPLAHECQCLFARPWKALYLSLLKDFTLLLYKIIYNDRARHLAKLASGSLQVAGCVIGEPPLRTQSLTPVRVCTQQAQLSYTRKPVSGGP
jgi:hypothetical protein